MRNGPHYQCTLTLSAKTDCLKAPSALVTDLLFLHSHLVTAVTTPHKPPAAIPKKAHQMEMSLQAWKEDAIHPFPTSQSHKFTVVRLLFSCLFGLFEYLNMNSSTIPVISFNKKYLELFHSKSTFFKIDAF